MPKKAVKVTLLSELVFFPVGQTSTEESVTFQEWILPLEAVQAIINTTEISTYRIIEKEVRKEFSTNPEAMQVARYIGYLRGKLERSEK